MSKDLPPNVELIDEVTEGISGQYIPDIGTVRLFFKSSGRVRTMIYMRESEARALQVYLAEVLGP